MDSEWEEVTIMMELPSSSHVDNRRQGDSYFQILGLSTEKPLVTVNGQLYSGQFTDTLGSHLFLEVEEKSDKEVSQKKNKQIKSVIVTNKSLKLEPVYLDSKKELRFHQDDDSTPELDVDVDNRGEETNVWSGRTY